MTYVVQFTAAATATRTVAALLLNVFSLTHSKHCGHESNDPSSAVLAVVGMLRTPILSSCASSVSPKLQPKRLQVPQDNYAIENEAYTGTRTAYTYILALGHSHEIVKEGWTLVPFWLCLER